VVPSATRPSGDGVPWRAYFWSGSALVWVAIGLIAFVPPAGFEEVAIFAALVAGLALISYSIRALRHSRRGVTPV
jgi:hypothetical protein